MRFLGIDYGSKRVGIALSDESGTFALPKAVLLNDKSLMTTVLEIVRTNGVGAIVVGESKNFKGEDNKIMKAARDFASTLGAESGVQIYLEPEFMTSQEASHTETRRRDRHAGDRASRGESKKNILDASAAALILKSFLDKRENSSN